MRPDVQRRLISTVTAWGDSFTPACACGCGEPVPIRVGRNGMAQPNKFVNKAHAAYDKHKPVKRTWKDRHTERKAEWGDSFPRACKCGCGEPVPINGNNGRPCEYVNSAHKYWTLVEWNRERQQRIAEFEVPAEDFKRALKAIMARKGLKCVDVAEIIGMPVGYVSSLYYRDYLYIKKPTAERILRRLAGQATPPTAYEQRKMTSRKRRMANLERELASI